MKKRYGCIFLVCFVLGILMVTPVSAANLFSEGFGTGNDWTTALPSGWTASDDDTSGMDDQLSVTGGSDGNRYAWLNGDSGDQHIEKAGISTSGYQNVELSYYYNLQGLSSDDFLVVEWKENSNGGYQLIQKVTGIPGWNSVTFDLPADADNTPIDIRFRAEGTEPSDYILIDDVKISGNSIENCGNNIIDNTEECDDGFFNQVNGECSPFCTLTFCGDGTPQVPNGLGTAGPQDDGKEACDDGNLINNDGCDNNCISLTPVCGNGVIEAGEGCDDKNTQSGDGCDANCQIETEFCGNNQKDTGEECDGTDLDGKDCIYFEYDYGTLACVDCVFDKTGCSDYICGNDVIEGNEECDGSNLNGKDCTDFGYDDGTLACSNCAFDTSGCFNYAECGNGILEDGEQCDDGNYNNHDSCLATCVNASCGDDYVWVNNCVGNECEECDDGNLVSGDGCDSQCNFEGGEQCFAPVDVMMVIDRSGSMVSPDPQRLQDAKNAAKSFLDEMDFTKDTAGLASFNESATLNQPLTSVNASVISAITALKAGGQTNIGDGIKVARVELVANEGENKVMILLSDGAPNAMTLANGTLKNCFIAPTNHTDCTIYAVNQSNITKAEGIEIFTIGLNITPFTEQLLKDIATDATHYFFAPNSSELESIYLNISEEICPCGGFDCSINTDNCNIGFCNLETDDCEFEPKPISTSCEEDGTKCTTQHCDGTGACVVNETVSVPEDDQCASYYCDPADGVVKPNNFELSTPCDNDQNECTTQHCDGGGDCVLLNQVQCDAPGLCENTNICNPNTGLCEVTYSQVSTPCETDANLCTTQHCDGGGDCVLLNQVQCDAPGVCEKDNICNPTTGVCEPVYSSLSTFCETDENECTIQHCNGAGQCVINPEEKLPPECVFDIIDSKVSQSMPTSNFGLGRYMIVNPKIAGRDRAYLRIDVSPLLGNSYSDADLKIAVYYTGSNVIGTQIEAWYCPEHDFIETAINWNNQPLDGDCTLADTYIILGTVIGGIPETWHSFNLTDELNDELNNKDGKFTIVLRSANEGAVNDNSEYVQYLTKDYSEEAYRPKFEVS